LIKLLDEYPKIFIVLADNVGSSQMQKIRVALRGKGVVLMGKNTMIRKAIRGHIENNKALEALLPHVKGNIGFVFVKDDLSFVRKVISENKVAAPAKAGSISPCDVIVPAGNTGMEPTQTSFLQALNIPSKITRGQVEIINDVHLIKEGAKVGTSEATLLAKLDIKPFKYGLTIKTVYDNGAIYDASLLDVTDDVLIKKFQTGVQNIAALSLAIGYPTVASLPHSVIRGFKNVLSLALAVDYSFPFADRLKSGGGGGGGHAPATAPAAKGGDAKGKGGAEAKPEKKPEPEPEEEDMSLSLFD
jgi:large subunit ribosomal protein LP0